MLRAAEIKEQFPALRQLVNGQPLIYFDNAATTQKPVQVIAATTDFYERSNSNIHRGVHTLSRRATDLYEDARNITAQFFGTAPANIIFTAGTTDGINIVAQGLATNHFRKDDEIILSSYEHHSNILPWQLLALQKGIRLKVLPLTDEHALDPAGLEALISDRTRLIAIAHVSNTLGVITDLSAIITLAKRSRIPVLVDGAQSAPHMPVDLSQLGADFFVCSAHKMYGPTGTGVLYMSEGWMEKLSLSRSGGGTIKTVTFENSEYVTGPSRFEPGTPNIAGVIGFAAALRFMMETGMETIASVEHELVQHAQTRLREIDEIELYGQSQVKAAVVSFNVRNAHASDVGTLLDKYGIAVRAGHHCTQPLMQCLNVAGTVRASFAIYNTIEEIDFFAEKMKKVIRMLS